MSLLSAVLVAFGILSGNGLDIYKAPDRGTLIDTPDEKEINSAPWWHNCP